MKVWQKAIDLAVDCCGIAKHLPARETYGLGAQIRRSAVSIPANIAEGHGRDHLGDYLRHLSIANGSLMELETHLLIAKRLSYLDGNGLDQLLIKTGEVSRMLGGLTTKLKSRHTNTQHLTPST